jgi:O-antigen ligase
MLDVPAGAAIAVAGIVVALYVAGGTSVVEPRARAALAGIALVAVVAGIAAGVSSPIRGRLSLSSSDRARVWSQTLDRVPDHLWLGTGPGTYTLVGEQNGRLVRTRFVHNEYLQALAETGLAGAASIAVAIVLIGTALLRARPHDEIWWACVAGCAAFAVHGSVDFLWRFPALVAFCFVLVGIASAGTDAETSNP